MSTIERMKAAQAAYSNALRYHYTERTTAAALAELEAARKAVKDEFRALEKAIEKYNL